MPAESIPPTSLAPKVEVSAGNIVFHCVACKHAHAVPLNQWNWNGSLDKPTITPSLRIFTPAVNEPGFNMPEQTVCHVNVTEGMLVYHGDSPHAYSGQTVPMVDWKG